MIGRVDLIELHVVIKPTTAARAERMGRELAAALGAGGDTLETLVTKAVRDAILNVNLADVRGPEQEPADS